MRFGLTVVALYAFGEVVLGVLLAPLSAYYQFGLITLVHKISAALGSEVHTLGVALWTPVRLLRIVDSCCGYREYWLSVSVVAAASTPVRRKLVWSVGLALAITTLNVIRLTSLVGLSQAASLPFDAAHQLIWPIINVGVGIAVAVVFFRGQPPEGRSVPVEPIVA